MALKPQTVAPGVPPSRFQWLADTGEAAARESRKNLRGSHGIQVKLLFLCKQL
jgi:hypothetical protein